MSTTMRRRSKTARIAALALWLVCLRPAFGQSTRIDGGTVSKDKFAFYWETRLQPPVPPLDGFTTETADEAGVIHRVLMDRTRRVFAGYDVIVQVLPEPNTYQVMIRPLEMNSALARRVWGNDPTNWNQMNTPGWSGLPSQTIKGGDVLELTLLSNRSTGQSVVDYITVQEPAQRFQGFNDPGRARNFSFAPGPARDFKTEDVELTIQSPRLSINGKIDESSTRRFDEVSGAIVWFASARRGRFLLSLVPRPEFGFRKAGEVRGTSLSFVIGNDTFSISTGHSIAPGQAAYSLYVLHEPDWKPAYANADLSVFVMGTVEPASLARK